MHVCGTKRPKQRRCSAGQETCDLVKRRSNAGQTTAPPTLQDKEEYRQAICLCATRDCRESFLHYAGSNAFDQVGVSPGAGRFGLLAD